MDQKILRYKNNLVVSGTGVIILGVWAMIKAIMYTVIQLSSGWESIEEEHRGLVVAVAAALIALFIAIAFALRVIIGRSAIREGKGGKGGKFYIVLSWIVLVFGCIGGLIDILSFGNNGILDSVAVLAIDATSIATLINLIFSAGKVRKSAKSGKAGETACN